MKISLSDEIRKICHTFYLEDNAIITKRDRLKMEEIQQIKELLNQDNATIGKIDNNKYGHIVFHLKYQK